MKRRAQTELIDSNLAPKFWTDVQISLPSIPRQAEAGAERLTKYFSDANVVNLVGCVWQAPPPPKLPIHQEQLLGARLTCHHHHASHRLSCQTPSNLLWNYLRPFVSSLSSASDTMCVIRPLVPHWWWNPRLAAGPASLDFIYNFSNCWIKHL